MENALSMYLSDGYGIGLGTAGLGQGRYVEEAVYGC